MINVISFYMNNIDPRVIDAQKKVIQTLNPAVKLHQILTHHPHGINIDTALWMGSNLLKTEKLIFLDIDCIPINARAIPNLYKDLETAALSGNIQRSNHIGNGEHLFVAPSCMAINLEKFDYRVPSSVETNRADVSEELTFSAEERGLQVKMYQPYKFEKEPYECKSWKLKEGMPEYGRFTYFNSGFMHAFQMRMGLDVDRFLEICAEVIA